ncbi:MAG: DNA polymerase beta superfamily protein [Phycisphaerales bacterium]
MPTTLDQSLIDTHLSQQPYPLLFVTVSGAHLYGFESPNSDYDLRGCHLLPATDMLGFRRPRETVEVMNKTGPIEIDIVTHDVRKYFSLLLKHNGYVLEQVFSPLVVQSSPAFEEIKTLAKGCITRKVHYHFFHFAQSQWKLVAGKDQPTVKGLLYTYRVLLAGMHVLRTGHVESNLRVLNETSRLGYIDDLIARKLAGDERQLLSPGELDKHRAEFDRLCAQLEVARDASTLPEEPTTADDLERLLVRLRLGTLGPQSGR